MKCLTCQSQSSSESLLTVYHTNFTFIYRLQLKEENLPDSLTSYFLINSQTIVTQLHIFLIIRLQEVHFILDIRGQNYGTFFYLVNITSNLKPYRICLKLILISGLWFWSQLILKMSQLTVSISVQCVNPSLWCWSWAHPSIHINLLPLTFALL